MAGPVDQKALRWERSVKLSREVIDECRVQLMLKFRFLDLALWRMPCEPVRFQARYPLATDAEKVYFIPDAELGRFSTSGVEAIRDYLHLVMHCIFRHPLDTTKRKRPDAWSLACDVVVENACIEMCGGRFESEDDDQRRQIVSELKLQVGTLSPAKLTSFFERVLELPEGASFQGFSTSRLNEVRDLFERDNHEAWAAFMERDSSEEPGEAEDIAEQGDEDDEELEGETSNDLRADGETNPDDADGQTPEDASGSSDEGKSESSEEGEDAQQGSEDSATGDDKNDTEEQAAREEGLSEEEKKRREDEKDWEEIAKQIEMNLETFSKEWGDEAGALIESLEIANRKSYDYSDFLRSFCSVSEEMKVNQEEFDYIFYTYGLKLYGNMPLVEPLEYMDTQRIRDFVIVIDTSESVRGDLVRKFLEHTFEILKESEDYASEVNIHLIQSDAKVQADTKITDLRDVDKIMENFHIRGYGGTDFRPAFDYVSSLRKRGEFEDLKGLIYFTDGLGQFPDEVPDYDVAFVFMDTGEPHLPSVPPWAMKVVIDEQGINEFKSKIRA
ncbi:MAG: VWA-like domain-containing protein [Coriobacteriales bacterium]|jgi:predicted metal-dependent peptidase